MQGIIQSTGLFLLPLASVPILPIPWVYAFYQNATALDDGEDDGKRVDRCTEQQAELSQFGKVQRFLAATRLSGVSPGFARGVIVDQLRYAQVSKSALIAEEQQELPTAVCRNDVLPSVGDVRLASKLPFLSSG